MSLLSLFFFPSAFSLFWFVTDSASTFPKQNLYLRIKRSKGGRESTSLFLLRVSGLYKHLLSLFQCPSLCSSVVLPQPTVFWLVPWPRGCFSVVGGRKAGHPCTPHTSSEQQHVFPVAVSMGTPSHRSPAQDCREGNVLFFQQRSCRACCMGRALLSTVFLPAFCPGGSFP